MKVPVGERGNVREKCLYCVKKKKKKKKKRKKNMVERSDSRSKRKGDICECVVRK